MVVVVRERFIIISMIIWVGREGTKTSDHGICGSRLPGQLGQWIGLKASLLIIIKRFTKKIII